MQLPRELQESERLVALFALPLSDLTLCCVSVGTSLTLSGFLPEMSNTAPPTKKIACLLLADQGQRRRRQRKHHTQRNSKISWKDIHDLVTAAWPQALHKPLSPLFL